MPLLQNIDLKNGVIAPKAYGTYYYEVGRLV